MRCTRGWLTRVRRLAVAPLLLLPAACATEPEGERSGGNRAREQLAAALAEPMDFGQDWDEGLPTSLADPLAQDDSTAAAEPSGPVWGIVLKTFSSEQHQRAAATMLTQLPQISPELGSSWVQTTPRGSIVAYGRYEGPDDPAAQRDLQWVKEITINNRRVFPRAMLSRLQRGDASSSSPYQLTSVRRKYPDINPLYTLQVAAWGSFGGAMSWSEVQQQAESDVRRLRGDGLPAYVHHDVNAQLSMVTVGLFDHRALNPRSGLYSSEVQALLRRFPVHLVNGQPVTNPVTRESQRPNLVLVPER
ncbi:MAG: hypothetical protein ACYTJ0_01385 [Planctomycetota bacterium]|jgi:hypothetical protein